MLSTAIRSCVVAVLGIALVSSAQAAEWRRAPGPLVTQWGRGIAPGRTQILPEYPRPQMVRHNGWTNLNGLWDYAIIGQGDQPKYYDGKIWVPFPIESSLSGVGKRVGPDQALWYRLEVETPTLAEGERLLLHFGAVDWEATVFVNGKQTGTHRGGYDPFTFEITDKLIADRPTQRIEVKVIDPTDAGTQPRGKQVRKPHGIWYTPVTGIWQTVWLEKVPASFIGTLDVVPDVDASDVKITAHVAGQAKQIRAQVIESGKIVASGEGEAGKPLSIKLDAPLLWTPDSPYLYDVAVELRDGDQVVDRVHSYFGMRKIALAKDDQGITRLQLNGKFLFQYGPLDQGYWPDGLYTAPSDQALLHDLSVTKQLGFNMVRKHVKVEPARWYYHCDRLGLLVWQDMPSGDRYIGPSEPDIVRTKESAEQFEEEWTNIIQSLKHFPSIVMWVPFNEGWGQYDTARIAKLTKKLDPTRLVDSVSGWADRGVGDVHDVHIYPGPGMPPPSEDRALVLGEFGGLGLPIEGHTWQAKDNWGYRSFADQNALSNAYEQLVLRLRPLIGQGLSAAVYTQTTDVEIEVNGLMTYDRAVLKFNPHRMAHLNRKLYLPPPEVVPVLPTSQQEGQKWRYTTEKPADGWNLADFDDSDWKEGEGGFGEESTPGAVVRTPWKSSDIWLRRTFELKESDLTGLALLVHYDDAAEIFVNGRLVATLTGYTTDYAIVPLNEQAGSAFGTKNTIAVHCHQKEGGQYIDVGLVRLVEQEQQ
jgi:hypothetical protein